MGQGRRKVKGFDHRSHHGKIINHGLEALSRFEEKAVNVHPLYLVNEPMNPKPAQHTVDDLRNKITDELIAALGLPRTGLARRVLGNIVRHPTTKFASMIAQADLAADRGGIGSAARCMLSQFDIRVRVIGAERIPADKPLLVVSNHPGAYDSLVLASSIERKDLDLVVSDIPFLRALPAASKYLIPVSANTIERMDSLRKCIQHLNNGGALLIFAHGDVEPDPAFMPGAYEELGNWSHSIEAMLRKVPETQLQIAIISGVLLPRFFDHPIARLRKELPKRQKLAEFLQIIQQMIFQHSAQANISVSFAYPTKAEELKADPNQGKWMPAVVRKARLQMEQHLQEIAAGTPVAVVPPAR
jgi:hypothetical protein